MKLKSLTRSVSKIYKSSGILFSRSEAASLDTSKDFDAKSLMWPAEIVRYRGVMGNVQTWRRKN